MTALILFEVTRQMLGSKHKSLEQFQICLKRKPLPINEQRCTKPSLDALRPVMQQVCEVLVARSFFAER